MSNFENLRSEIEAVSKNIAEVEENILKVETNINELEAKSNDVKNKKEENWKVEFQELQDEKKQLRRKKEQLRRKEEQLRDEKKQLRRKEEQLRDEKNQLRHLELVLAQRQQPEDLPEVRGLSLKDDDRSIVKCQMGDGRAASDFAADKSVKYYDGVGFMSHLVCYDATSLDHHPEERAKTATQLLHPGNELLTNGEVVCICNALFDITLCNYDLSKISEEPKKNASRNVQECYLDRLEKCFEKNHFRTSTSNSFSMGQLNCEFGFASAQSSPDAVGIDDNGVVRMVFEVKHNVSTPAVALRQAISEGTNVAWAQLRCGVKWSDIYVPLVGGNGHLMQFAVVACLNPGFPISFMMSKVLDLTDFDDRLVAAGHLSKIKSFMSSPLKQSNEGLSNEDLVRTAGYNPNLYHLKSQEAFFASKGNYDDSLLHLLAVMNTLFADEETRKNILFPLSIRQGNSGFELMFRKLSDYYIGVPKDSVLRRSYIECVRQVLYNIHKCGVAHLDFYPSNIMWKQDGEESVHIMIIDWDSGHFIHEDLHQCVSERLRGNRYRLMSTYVTEIAKEHTSSLVDYDMSLYKVLEDNIDHESLQVSEKAKLDNAFFRLSSPEKPQGYPVNYS